MPNNDNHEHISAGRLKALEMAGSQVSELYTELANSRVIASPVIERLRILRLLIVRAANQPLERADGQLLDQVLGEDLGAANSGSHS